MLSRRKKYAYILLIVGAGAAFIIDRAFGPGPKPANATASSTNKQNSAARGSSAAAPNTQSKSAGSSVPTAPEDPVAHTLRNLPEVLAVRDLFARQEFLARQDAADDGRGKHEEKSDPVADFLASHCLQATFKDDQQGSAIINRQLVRTGQVVDGFRLVAVEPFRAVFQAGKLRAVLELNVPDKDPETRRPADSPNNPATSPGSPDQ